MDRSVIVPSLSDLEFWIQYLLSDKNVGFGLKPYMPSVGPDWYDGVMKVMGVLELSHYKNYSLHEVGAWIFYKINKAHNQIDSNKRSSIIVLYLFYLINGCYVNNPEEVKKWAKKIAKSKGRKREDWWRKRLEKFLASSLITLE